LKQLREGIQRNCPYLWKNNNWFLHNDIAPAHRSLDVRQFMILKKYYSDSLPNIRLIPPTATSSYFPGWNYGWTGVILTWLRRSMQNRKRLSTHSHSRTSRDAWYHGKQAGITV
jgi:hypothetical protein